MPNVEVNETNIDLFALTELTGNSREEMLNMAADASAKGYVFSVKVPDELIHMNIFDAAVEVESPIADALTANNRCRYEKGWVPKVGDIWVCIIHNQNSKHDVLLDAKAPCLEVDPY